MIYLVIGVVNTFIALLRLLARFNPFFIEFLIIFNMLVLATFRGLTVGADTENYINFFINSPNIFNYTLDFHPELEYGFKLYLSFLKIFFENVNLFFLISSIICILPIYIGLKKISPNYAFLGLLVYFLVFYLNYPINVLRQGMAMGIFVYTVPYMLDKKSFAVLFMSFVAGSLHTTGYLIFFAYIYSLFENKKLIYITIFLGLLSLVCYQFKILQSILFSFTTEGKELIFTEKYDSSTSLSQYLYRILLVVFFATTAILSKNKILIKIFLIYFFGFFVYISLSENNLLASRFNMFFRVLEVIMIPMIFTNILSIFTRFLIFIIILFLYLPFFLITIFLPENSYVFNIF